MKGGIITGHAVKAILHGLGMEAYGHSISALLLKLPRDFDSSSIMQEAKTLDKYYVPTRYPNVWSEKTANRLPHPTRLITRNKLCGEDN